MNIDISIIIPVYNTEKYIFRCAESLFNQTKRELEFIFVDDHSTDNSIEILNDVIEQFSERKEFVRIIRNSQNFRQAISRQIGLNAASGTYVMYVDSDDWLEPFAVERFLYYAQTHDADMVACEIVMEFGKKKKEIRFSRSELASAEPFQDINYSVLFSSFCNKLFKRELLMKSETILDSSITQWEDLAAMFPLRFFVKKFRLLPEVLYHYERSNPKSMTAVMSLEKVLQRGLAAEKCEEFLQKHHLLPKYTPHIRYLKFLSKTDLLACSETFAPAKWRSHYTDTNRDFWRYPHFALSFRLVFLAAILHLDFLVFLGTLLRDRIKKRNF